ncbi:hypothetical protein LEM8419_02915 [Neolewinella maritima]|uniref:Alpha-L-rhamnosidase six-hairpin glycosidase domain-containing protein n=1 Tax=Neolewinella maritima TaxID=1383882 RepID=A0ABN8F4X8_9BACT|nr:hypothetical protein [Neolewinella maritima]CAH1002000.1 hypothetical protein LEM8419_02915 [Neolewinella maritima]
MSFLQSFTVLNLLWYALPVLALAPAAPPWPAAEYRLGANWITHPEVAGQEHGVVLFRRDFEVTTLPDSFVVDVTADNHFRLYLNGAWVAFGPQLGDVEHWRLDRIDLTDYLRPGQNTLAVQVVNWGYHRMFGLQSVHTALLVQGYGAAEVLTTTGYDGNYQCLIDNSIRAHEVKWRTGNNDIIGGLYANNPTDSLHVAAHPWGWEQPVYDAAHWRPAVFIEQGSEVTDGTGFRWMLQPRTVPPQRRSQQRFRRVPIQEGVRLPPDWTAGSEAVDLPAHGSYRLLLDMQEVTLGLATLRWSGGAGARIKYTWAENLFNEDRTKPHRDSTAGKLVKGYFDVVLPDGSAERSYVPTWYRTCRYLEILVETAAHPLQLYAPTLDRVTSSIPITASWQSDDARLDSIVAAGRRTVELCTQDYFLSDAYYETMQYVGDTKVHALVWQALSGDDRHTRNALLDFHHGRNPEGMLKSCFPLRHNFFHSSYSLVYVDMVWDYFARTNDTAFVRPLLPGIRLTLDYFARHYDPASGLLRGVMYKPFVDWYPNGKHGLAEGGDPNASVPYTLQYAHALQSASLLAAALEQTGDDYGTRHRQVVEAIRSKYYLPDRHLVAERSSLDFFDQHSNILAVLTGVIPEAAIDAVLQTTVRDSSLVPATYYFRYYLLEALRLHQRADLLRHALQPWYDMIAEGATTQVERFETPTKPTRSEAHPWGAAPALFVYTLLAGIDDINPEGQVVMRPAFGHLTSMQGYYPFLRGRGGVRFDLQRSGESGIRGTVSSAGRDVSLHWRGEKVRVPAGTSREIYVECLPINRGR